MVDVIFGLTGKRGMRKKGRVGTFNSQKYNDREKNPHKWRKKRRKEETGAETGNAKKKQYNFEKKKNKNLF